MPTPGYPTRRLGSDRSLAIHDPPFNQPESGDVRIVDSTPSP